MDKPKRKGLDRLNSHLPLAGNAGKWAWCVRASQATLTVTPAASHRLSNDPDDG
jgi:hypothetical protein